MKFCIDCQHMNKFRKCSFPINNCVLDMVTAMPLRTPQVPEEMRINEALCGAQGMWFKQRKIGVNI